MANKFRVQDSIELPNLKIRTDGTIEGKPGSDATVNSPYTGGGWVGLLAGNGGIGIPGSGFGGSTPGGNGGSILLFAGQGAGYGNGGDIDIRPGTANGGLNGETKIYTGTLSDKWTFNRNNELIIPDINSKLSANGFWGSGRSKFSGANDQAYILFHEAGFVEIKSKNGSDRSFGTGDPLTPAGPGNTISITAGNAGNSNGDPDFGGTGGQIIIQAGDGTYSGNPNGAWAESSGLGGSIQLNSGNGVLGHGSVIVNTGNNKVWEFDKNGTLKIPGDIQDNNGVSFLSQKVSAANLPLDTPLILDNLSIQIKNNEPGYWIFIDSTSGGQGQFYYSMTTNIDSISPATYRGYIVVYGPTLIGDSSQYINISNTLVEINIIDQIYDKMYRVTWARSTNSQNSNFLSIERLI